MIGDEAGVGVGGGVIAVVSSGAIYGVVEIVAWPLAAVDVEVELLGDEWSDNIAGAEPMLLYGIVAPVEIRRTDAAVVPLMFFVKTATEFVVAEEVT